MIETTPKRASIHTLGCRLNQAESGLLTDMLEAAGYAIVPFGEAAELGIVHSCTVTREADTKSRKMLRQFIRKNPGGYAAIIGCYAQMSPAALSEIEGVDLILGNQEKLHLLEYVRQGKNPTPLIVRDRLLRDDFTVPFQETGPPISRRMNLKIQDGCDSMCSFCVIPFARGRVRARAMDDLIAEARALIARGVREIVLTGINLGTYRHAGEDFLRVIERLGALPGLDRLRISSIEPATVPEEIFGMMADNAHPLTPYLHIPVQSGANRILDLMRRDYSREAYLDLISRAAAAVPDLGLGADFMVGFPGETEADFEETVALLETSPIAYTHIFKYSERRGTAASRLPDKVDPDTMARRSARLHRLGAAKLQAHSEKFPGRTLDVLFESCEEGYWTGYTGNYLRVAVRSKEDLTNVIRTVRLDRAAGEIMIGTLI